VLASAGADTERLVLVGREAAIGIQRLFRGVATV
jgi:hypothetical protein